MSKFSEKNPLILMLLDKDYHTDSRVLKEIKVLSENNFNILLFYSGDMSLEIEQKIFKNAVAFNIRSLENIHQYYNKIKKLSPIVIHCHDFETMSYGLFLKKRLNIPLIYDSHELWGYNIFLKNKPFKAWFIKKMDSYYLKKADRIIFPNNLILDFSFKKHGLYRKKLFSVKNTPFIANNISPTLRKKYPFLKNKKIVIYQGGIQKGRSIEIIVEAAKKIIAIRPDIHFVLLGQLISSSYLFDMKIPDNILVIPPVSPDKLLEITADADIGLSLIEPISKSYFLSSATKVFEYIMAGIPALYSDLPFHRMMVKKFNTGIILKTLSSDALKDKIIEFLDNSIESKNEFKINCFKAKKIFNFENDSKTLLKVYENIDSNSKTINIISYKSLLENDYTSIDRFINRKILLIRSAPNQFINSIHSQLSNYSSLSLLCQKSYKTNKDFNKIYHLLPDRIFEIKDIFSINMKNYKEYDCIILPCNSNNPDDMLALSLLCLKLNKRSWLFLKNGNLIKINIKTIFAILSHYYKLKHIINIIRTIS